jgi:hypothetical protein
LSRKLLAVVLTLVLAGWLLQGCWSSGAEMAPATASTLQGDVVKVASAADASRWEAAIEALDQLGSDVASAQAAGGISDQRAAQIRAVRQRVLEDLQRIRPSSPTPRPATTMQTTPSTEPNDNGRNGGGNDDQGGKHQDDDQGEDGGGKHNGNDQSENGGKHKGKNKE